MKVGIIGTGNWGHRVVPEYIALKDEGTIDGVGVCDNQKSTIKQYSENNNITILSSNYNAFLDKVDAVHICVGNRMHYDIARTALRKNVHVLIEKPMTKTVNEAQILTEMALERGLVLQVGHIFRFANVIRKARDLYRQHFFGELCYITMHWTTHWLPSQESDIVWDLLPHPLDMIHFIIGEWPVGGKLVKRSYRESVKSDIALVTLDYNDFVAMIELSWVTHQRKRLLHIVGLNRMAAIEAVAQELTVYEESGSNKVDIVNNNTILAEARNFVESIKNGKMKFNSAYIGLENVRAISNLERGSL